MFFLKNWGHKYEFKKSPNLKIGGHENLNKS
jgi:hypothetical protein